ncbi:endonuclease V isoform X6 [Gorilla gorilla gorilla]|uniref:endonuclease V isoform X6 n=1 Tax=Gorilla gorilla gorilla TaxID=9595 RepID=UPI002445AFB4|nr:endonuclease V isoform X6 [Gorilla gorilla gorilla]
MALEAAGGPPEETLSLWKREQARLKAHVVDRDTETWQRDPAFSGLQRVGGVDVSFVKGDSVRACASLVVLSFPELEVLLVDGNGVLHHRGFGVACHLGVLTDLPCVGVAKKLLQVDGLENNALHKEKIRLLQTQGDSFPLLGDSGTVLGMALRSHDRSTRPLYISVGHRMSLEAAVRLTRCCCRFRIPEPVRQVHLLLCSRRSWESTDGVSVGLLSPWLRAGPSWPHGHRRCCAPGCQVQALLPGQAGPLQGKADICSREHIRKSLGLPGPPTPSVITRSPKAQRPVACPKGDSGESSGGAPSPQRQADRTTPGGRRSTAQHQVGQR